MRMPSSLTGWDLVCVAKFRLEREFVEIGTFSSPVSFQPVATVHYFPCKDFQWTLHQIKSTIFKMNYNALLYS